MSRDEPARWQQSAERQHPQSRPPLEVVVVVVPIHNEEVLLPRCLTALGVAIAAARRLPNPPEFTVHLVLDACTDDSDQIAQASPHERIAAEFQNVGEARALGVDRALDTHAAVDRRSVWISTTDADSSVPENWLSEQIDLAHRGIDLMIGTVRPDFADLDELQQEAWTRTHTPEKLIGNIHGANLGFRADRYLRAGGFPPVAEHEDIQLVAALRALPQLVEVATDDCWVLTSGRGVGRTPGGYAGYLTNDLLVAGGSGHS